MLPESAEYRQVLDRLAWCRARGYGIFEVGDDEVALARLFAYAWRTQTVGAYRAARLLLEARAGTAALGRAVEALRGLEELALLTVPADFRALVGTLSAYERGVRTAVVALDEELAAGEALAAEGTPALGQIRERLVANLGRVTGGNGIWTASDLALPEQGSFSVPGIAVVIVPLVYGDHHSWNNALVPGSSVGQTTHRHRQGVEIHLGYSPLAGRTLLGEHATPLREGYAMPILPGVDHGFDNDSPDQHLVPFIFGSLRLGGWGLFADVEPRPRPAESYADAPLESEAMNGSRYLERAIAAAAAWPASRRQVLIPAARTATPTTGGLELGIARLDKAGLDLTGERYRILSIRRGRGRLRLGPVAAELAPHDHVGLPAGLAAHLAQIGDEPLVLLEATIEPAAAE